jgi:hypothetical protein
MAWSFALPSQVRQERTVQDDDAKPFSACCHGDVIGHVVEDFIEAVTEAAASPKVSFGGWSVPVTLFTLS